MMMNEPLEGISAFKGFTIFSPCREMNMIRQPVNPVQVE